MSPNAERMFSQAVRLPQIPHVMQHIVASLRDDNVSIAALADIVANDQVIAAKVLRLANSSYYGAGRNVAGIGDAVKLIGLNAFRNLVIASSLANAFPKVEGFDLAAFWRNSMLVANLAHLIGRDLAVDRETLFSAGLMHGIGQLLIFLCLPAEAQAMAAEYRRLPLTELRAMEQRSIQMDHFEIGAELARRWNFPESIQTAIGQYDAPDAASLTARIVHAAVLIAQGIQAHATFGDMLAQLPPSLAECLHLDKAWFEEEGEVFDLLLDEAAALV